jgi:hypothetical protein
MPTELTWKAPFATTCLHLADGLARGLPLVDPRLEPAMASAARLKAALEWTGAPPGRMWRLLTGLSGQNQSPSQMAELALVKTIGRGERMSGTAAALAGAIADLLANVRNAVPSLEAELEHRERPLREQWEARGPGLLHQVVLLTEPALMPPQADILLVHPCFGGAGMAHLPFNSVRIEAVLANPHADLPEILRMAWLLSQLQLDLPLLSENIHADRLPHVARLAMLPAVLKAADNADLVPFSPQTIERALAAWQLSVPPGVDAVTMLKEWWETYELDHPPFRVALAALDAMVG